MKVLTLNDDNKISNEISKNLLIFPLSVHVMSNSFVYIGLRGK